MGTALTGLVTGSTYNGLLKTTDNAVLSGALRVITDGFGNDSALQISTAGVASSGSLSVAGDTTLSGTSGTAGHGYIFGPSVAGKFVTLQSGNTTGGINFRNSTGTEVGQYNQSTDLWTFSKPVALKQGTTTYAALPAAATAGAGAMIYISDCNSTTRLATAAGGGANKVMVFSDGTNWLVL